MKSSKILHQIKLSWQKHWTQIKYSPLVLAVLSLVWFFIRVIPKPTRMGYPCQQATLSYLSLFLSGTLVTGVIGFGRKIIKLTKNHWPEVVIGSLIILFVVVGWEGYKFHQLIEFRKKWSRTIPAPALSQAMVKGITASNSVVSFGYDSNALYGQTSPYDSATNPAYDFVWQTIEELNLGSSPNPLEELIDAGDTLLIKINMVSGDTDSIPFTNPATVRPLVDMAVAAGADHIQIGDGGLYYIHTNDAFERTGYDVFINQLQAMYPGVNIELVNFNDDAHWRWVYLGSRSSFAGSGFTDGDLADSSSNPMAGSQYYRTADSYGTNPNGQCLGWYAVSTYILNADVIINVPKLKVHPSMIITSAIKSHAGSVIASTYGANNWIGGPRIAHKELNNDSAVYFNDDVFWRAILDVNKIVLYGDSNGNLQSTKQRKYLNVIDGIQAAEQGHFDESDIIVNDLGVIMASQDPVALDAVASRVMGYNFRVIPQINNASTETSYVVGTNDPINIVVAGENLDNRFNHVFEYNDNWEDLASAAGLPITDFDPPQIVNVQTRESGNVIEVTAQINNGLVAFVEYISQGQKNIQSMHRSGNQYNLNIPLGSSNIKIIAQDNYFNSISQSVSSGQGDLDSDGDVDIFDYNLLVENFGSTNCGNVADIDANCKVDIFDYNILVENFGK